MKNQPGGGKLSCVGFAVGVFLLIAPLVLAALSVVNALALSDSDLGSEYAHQDLAMSALMMQLESHLAPLNP